MASKRALDSIAHGRHMIGLSPARDLPEASEVKIALLQIRVLRP
jgi:hypothetical protein